MDKLKSIAGEVFGKLTVVRQYRSGGRTYAELVCDDGHRADRRCDTLNDKSYCRVCTKNPQYKTRAYNSWESMRSRCRNPNSTSYYKYGAVGIDCTEEWVLPGGEGWINFYADMGDCPEGYTLDRYPDKFGNYCKENCRWATYSQQGYNQKRRNTNTSGRTGVSWDSRRDRWVAQITFENEGVSLGNFNNFEDAVKAREEAELKYFGENKE